MRRCSRCKQDLPDEAFSQGELARQRAGGYCRQCKAERRKTPEQREANRLAAKRYRDSKEGAAWIKAWRDSRMADPTRKEIRCGRCCQQLPVAQFFKPDVAKGSGWCRSCRRDYNKQRSSTEKGQEETRRASSKYLSSEKGKASSRARLKRDVENVTDRYIKSILVDAGWHKPSITQELIQFKRVQIQIKRLVKELK